MIMKTPRKFSVTSWPETLILITKLNLPACIDLERKTRKTNRCEIYISVRFGSSAQKRQKKLKGKPFQINQQFPEEIEQARKSLYPIMKEHKQKGDHVKLVRDILYINGQPYDPETEEEYSNPPRRDRPTPNRHRSVSNKRRRISSSQETR